jgi:hypothetical protein
LVNTLNKITHYRWLVSHFVIHPEHLFTHLWTFYTTVLQFFHSLHFGCKLRIIHDGFMQHLCF